MRIRQSGGDGAKLQVSVDGTAFTVLRKGYEIMGDTQSRIFYELLNNKLGKKFYAYRSGSEGGILRLQRTSRDKLVKGVDYVQSSSLHYRLQEFINQHDAEIPMVKELAGVNFDGRTDFTYVNDRPVAINIDDYAYLYRDQDFGSTPVSAFRGMKTVSRTHSIYRDDDDNPVKRELINPRLYPLTLCMSGTCWENGPRRSAFEEFISNIRSHCGDDVSWAPDDYQRVAEDSCQAVVEITDVLMKDDEFDLPNMVRKFSQYLESHFKVVGRRRVAELADFVGGYQSFEIVMKYLEEVTIEDLASGEQIALLVLNYQFRDSSKTNRFAGDYRIIIGAVPPKVGATRVGTYQHYYLCGILAYKPMEYMSVLSPYARLRDYDPDQIHPIGDQDYIFIGHVMNQMWPLPDLH